MGNGRKQRSVRLCRMMKSCCWSKIHSPQRLLRRPKPKQEEEKGLYGMIIIEEEEEEEEDESSNIHSLPDDLLMECLARLPRTSMESVMKVCKRFSKLIRCPSFYEVRQSLGNVEKLVFVFGGAGTGLRSAVYCKGSDGWGAGLLFCAESLQGDEWFLDYHTSDNSLLYAQAAPLRHQIFILGAMLPCHLPLSEKMDFTIVYDVWSKSLLRRSPMLNPRKKFACCVISDRIYVAGGALVNDSCREAIVDAEEYVPELDLWKPIANMPRKRYGCLGAAVNGMFYVIGGLKFGNMSTLSVQPYAYVSSMECYDTKTKTWLRTKALPMGGCVISCTVVGCCIYMLSSHAVELSFWKYVTHTDSWMRLKPPPIPSPVRLDNVLKFSCVTIGSSVYVIQVGGSIDDLLRRSERSMRGLKEGLVLIYDTKLQEWQRGPYLPFIQNGAACAVVEC